MIMSPNLVLTFNAGSSSIKLGLFEVQGQKTARLARGVIDLRKKPVGFRMAEGPSTFDVELHAEMGDDPRAVLLEAFGWLSDHYDMSRVAAIGHRVVHGGDQFDGPTAIDDASIEAMQKLTPLAPLHQPQNLRLIKAIRQVRPDLPQSASFDTAFHRTNEDIVRRFAIPRTLHDRGIKRYGFHGLSYKHISVAMAQMAPTIGAGSVIAAHLGSGASLCAMKTGVSCDTSMGFSALDGIPMATRCGALDPGVLLHLLASEMYTIDDLEDLLYHQSGLLGVSGISADSRELLALSRPEAKEAIDLFTFRIAGEAARLAGTLGGLDAIVFTAGIGENQPEIRAGICARLRWLGIELDPALNAANAPQISVRTSRIAAYIIPADEEQIIADETLVVLSRAH